VFQGSWDKGDYKDVGVHTTASGTMYMGEWLGGIRQGYGCELGGDGDWYRGQFEDDAITGWVCHAVSRISHGFLSHVWAQGEMVWADGAVHRGKWVNGTLAEIAMSKSHVLWTMVIGNSRVKLLAYPHS
jgi:hypothetical protein